VSVKRLSEAIEREEQLCAERVWKIAQPLLQVEFNRMRKRYPDFERIMFGHGTHYFSFKNGTKYDSRNVQLPKSFGKLDEMCAMVQWKYAADDIVPSVVSCMCGKPGGERSIADDGLERCNHCGCH